jgi:hypothetical protein
VWSGRQLSAGLLRAERLTQPITQYLNPRRVGGGPAESESAPCDRWVSAGRRTRPSPVGRSNQGTSEGPAFGRRTARAPLTTLRTDPEARRNRRPSAHLPSQPSGLSPRLTLWVSAYPPVHATAMVPNLWLSASSTVGRGRLLPGRSPSQCPLTQTSCAAAWSTSDYRQASPVVAPRRIRACGYRRARPLISDPAADRDTALPHCHGGLPWDRWSRIASSRPCATGWVSAYLTVHARAMAPNLLISASSRSRRCHLGGAGLLPSSNLLLSASSAVGRSRLAPVRSQWACPPTQSCAAAGSTSDYRQSSPVVARRRIRTCGYRRARRLISGSSADCDTALHLCLGGHARGPMFTNRRHRRYVISTLPRWKGRAAMSARTPQEFPRNRHVGETDCPPTEPSPVGRTRGYEALRPRWI